MEGRVVAGWRVVRHIATGGFGSIYEVVREGDGRIGALKILHAHFLKSAEMVTRLVREAEIIGRLQHPHIVELLGAGLDHAGRPYLVMELIDGPDLAQVLRKQQRLAPVAQSFVGRGVNLYHHAVGPRGHRGARHRRNPVAAPRRVARIDEDRLVAQLAGGRDDRQVER